MKQIVFLGRGAADTGGGTTDQQSRAAGDGNGAPVRAEMREMPDYVVKMEKPHRRNLM